MRKGHHHVHTAVVHGASADQQDAHAGNIQRRGDLIKFVVCQVDAADANRRGDQGAALSIGARRGRLNDVRLC